MSLAIIDRSTIICITLQSKLICFQAESCQFMSAICKATRTSGTLGDMFSFSNIAAIVNRLISTLSRTIRSSTYVSASPERAPSRTVAGGQLPELDRYHGLAAWIILSHMSGIATSFTEGIEPAMMFQTTPSLAPSFSLPFSGIIQIALKVSFRALDAAAMEKVGTELLMIPSTSVAFGTANNASDNLIVPPHVPCCE